jgi:hypothetical protein
MCGSLSKVFSDSQATSQCKHMQSLTSTSQLPYPYRVPDREYLWRGWKFLGITVPIFSHVLSPTEYPDRHIATSNLGYQSSRGHLSNNWAVGIFVAKFQATELMSYRVTNHSNIHCCSPTKLFWTDAPQTQATQITRNPRGRRCL